MSERTIYRKAALERYAQAQAQAVAPPDVRPKGLLLLWVVVGVLGAALAALALRTAHVLTAGAVS